MTFPDLSSEKIIALDIETNDPSIGAGLGSGARRDGCYILGVGIAVPGKEFYFPLTHYPADNELFEGEKIENVESFHFFEWLRDLKHVPTIGANILYDLDYLQYQNYIPDEIHDIQFCEPLLDENKKSYSLDELAQEYLNEKKSTKEIDNWCKARGLKGKSQSYLAQMPAAMVGKYCKEDCRQTLEIFQKQIPKIKSEGLETVYNLERSLIPVLLKMKRQGVRMDLKKFKNLKMKSEEKQEKIKNELKEKYQIEMNENGNITPTAILRAFDKYKIPYRMNGKANPCFAKDELLKTKTELGNMIVEYRHIQKVLGTYINGFEPHLIGDRIHTEFNPLRQSKENGDEYGTRIGRFSSTAPCLQVIPRPDEDEDSPDDEGKLIRSLFIPEENCLWAKADYSKMEMMSALHFAGGEGSDAMRRTFCQNPELDPYKIIAAVYYNIKYDQVTKQQRGLFKTQTLASMYGMGPDKLGRNMGTITKEEIKGVSKKYWDEVFSLSGKWESRLEKALDVLDIDERPYFDQYFESWKKLNEINKKIPWMKSTSKHYQEKAEKDGFVRTKLGRIRRFVNNEGTYRAFQFINSGSCADIMKSAMLKGYQDGIFDVIPCHLTVHDELDVSLPDTKAGKDALGELKNIMETIIPLRVPLRVEIKTGKSWGEVQ
jgi:DNA polymerase I-like protein with 3'-5' exonuclease and polymerase domains